VCNHAISYYYVIGLCNNTSLTEYKSILQGHHKILLRRNGLILQDNVQSVKRDALPFARRVGRIKNLVKLNWFQEHSTAPLSQKSVIYLHRYSCLPQPSGKDGMGSKFWKWQNTGLNNHHNKKFTTSRKIEITFYHNKIIFLTAKLRPLTPDFQTKKIS